MVKNYTWKNLSRSGNRKKNCEIKIMTKGSVKDFQQSMWLLLCYKNVMAAITTSFCTMFHHTGA